MPGTSEARILFDRRFDGVCPQAVAQVGSESDIAKCIAFAQRFGLPLRLRSGGHSYIGASIGPGLVIDLRHLDNVSVDSAAGTTTIGAGAALVDVYGELADHGVSIPAGSCPSVGLSGLTLGGGVGVVARRYGLTCDRLVEARVITADGNTLICNATSHSDLYWALRGGGGSFGVVSSLTLGTHAANPLAHAFVTWPWSAAAQVVTGWQPWATSAPSSLWSSAHVLATDGTGDATISVAAVMVGTESALSQQIGQLVQSIPTSTDRHLRLLGQLRVHDDARERLLDAHDRGNATSPTRPPAARCPATRSWPGPTSSSTRFLPAGINALVAAVEQRQNDPRLGSGGASLDILGGAVDHVAADATAWVHRGALFNAQYTASWGETPGNGPLARNQHSLASIHGTVRPYASAPRTRTTPTTRLPNPQQAYYGANLAAPDRRTPHLRPDRRVHPTPGRAPALTPSVSGGGERSRRGRSRSRPKRSMTRPTSSAGSGP